MRLSVERAAGRRNPSRSNACSFPSRRLGRRDRPHRGRGDERGAERGAAVRSRRTEWRRARSGGEGGEGARTQNAAAVRSCGAASGSRCRPSPSASRQRGFSRCACSTTASVARRRRCPLGPAHIAEHGPVAVVTAEPARRPVRRRCRRCPRTAARGRAAMAAARAGTLISGHGRLGRSGASSDSAQGRSRNSGPQQRRLRRCSQRPSSRPGGDDASTEALRSETSSSRSD